MPAVSQHPAGPAHLFHRFEHRPPLPTRLSATGPRDYLLPLVTSRSCVSACVRTSHLAHSLDLRCIHTLLFVFCHHLILADTSNQRPSPTPPTSVTSRALRHHHSGPPPRPSLRLRLSPSPAVDAPLQFSFIRPLQLPRALLPSSFDAALVGFFSHRPRPSPPSSTTRHPGPFARSEPSGFPDHHPRQSVNQCGSTHPSSNSISIDICMVLESTHETAH